MSVVLSQKEIDELLASFGGGQAPAERGQEPKEDRPVRVYDFRRPDKFSKEHLRTLQMLHETAARHLTSAFSAYFRSMTQVSLNSVDQMIYSEFARSLASPGILAMLSLAPFPGNAVLDMAPSVTFEMIDRLLGGDGSQMERGRAVTEIEQAVVQKVVQVFLGGLREAWEGVAELSPLMVGLETNPMFAQVVGPNETCVMMGFAVRLGQTRGSLNLCLPFVTLESILPKLSAQQWIGAARTSEEGGQTMARSLELAPIPVSVELGRADVSVRRLTSLAVGDVITLNTPSDRELVVYVGNKPKFVGRPGTIGVRLAIQITGLADQEEGVLE